MVGNVQSGMCPICSLLPQRKHRTRGLWRHVPERAWLLVASVQPLRSFAFGWVRLYRAATWAKTSSAATSTSDDGPHPARLGHGAKAGAHREALAALPPGGALVVFESIIDHDRRENAFGLMMSMNMLIETPGGLDYTQPSAGDGLGECDFRETYVEHLVGLIPWWLPSTKANRHVAAAESACSTGAPAG